INLSWTAPTSNGGSAITGYKIERSTDSGTTWSTIVANTANTAITYSDTGLAASSTYTYRVSAINSIGTSSPSNTASTTTSGTSTTQVAISVNSVDLSGKPITGMSTVIRYTNGTTITEGFTPISFTVTSGTTYVVHVRDYGNNVFNHWSDGTTNSYFTITPTQNTVLTAYYSTASVTTVPTSLTATAASSQINLSWTAPTSNGGSAITGYKIERSTDSGTTWSTIVANTANTAITYSDTGLAASSTYTYRVSAINSIGTSSPSNTASATTASTQLSLTIKSVDMSGNPITGMSTVIRYANGTTIAEGFTPISFTVTSGTTYVVHVRDYLTTVFNHWSDGTTNSYFTITPTQNTVLTAYYSTG
ncbi:MAG TPA: fibronectin type III domain-containing protein, partial [Nitrosopumilaceae archaeon]|nr:fibronectin type III domain-containing protein [Nitrosopumilaceae archaeon]